LSLGITPLLGGFLADRYDNKKIIVIGALIWIPVPLALSMATNWNQLWLPMFLYGTFFGNTAICVYILRSTPPEKTMQAFGFWSASVALGYVFSPIVGGFIASGIGRQTVFLTAACFYGVSVLPLFFIQKLSKSETQEAPVIPEYNPPKFRKFKRLIVLSAFFSLIVFAIFLINPLISQYMHDFYNQSIFNLGVFGAATSFGWIFFSFALGKIGDKYSKMAAVLMSTAICIFSLVVIAIVNNFPSLFFASFLAGASRCIFGFVWAVTGSAAPERYAGRWISVSQASINIVSFGAPIIGGILYQISPYLAFLTTILLLSSLTLLATFKKL
jgi:MFS family permease